MLILRAMASLAEPLITKDMWTNEISRLSLSAIRAVLSLLYDSRCSDRVVRIKLT